MFLRHIYHQCSAHINFDASTVITQISACVPHTQTPLCCADKATTVMTMPDVQGEVGCDIGVCSRNYLPMKTDHACVHTCWCGHTNTHPCRTFSMYAECWYECSVHACMSADTAVSGRQEGGLLDAGVESLHLILSNLLSDCDHQYGMGVEQRAALLKALRRGSGGGGWMVVTTAVWLLVVWSVDRQLALSDYS